MESLRHRNPLNRRTCKIRRKQKCGSKHWKKFLDPQQNTHIHACNLGKIPITNKIITQASGENVKTVMVID